MENDRTPRLTVEQKAALEVLLDAVKDKATAALIGPAGSGKTTVIRALLKRLGADRVVVLCPTHKARAVVSAGLPGARTATVAATLRLRPAIDGESGQIQFNPSKSSSDAAGFMQDGRPPVALILDESSMVTGSNVYALERLAERLGAALLLVGDEAQLPPVEAVTSGFSSASAMAQQFTDNDRTARLDTVMRTGTGPVLQLSRAIRHCTDLRPIWPTESQQHGDSRICMYRWENAWLGSAATAFSTEEWAADPNHARVLCWTHRESQRLAALIRRHQHPNSHDQWHQGEWLVAPSGIPQPGKALGNPIAPACSEFQILNVESPQTFTRANAEFTWHTPAKRQERIVRVEATTQASTVTVQHDGKQLDLLLETPDHLGSWSSQCKELRRLVKAKFNGSNSDRKALFKYIADLESMLPNLRSATTQTIHASQGSSYQHVFLSRDIRFALAADPADAKRLAYVAVSRTRGTLHLQPLSNPQ